MMFIFQKNAYFLTCFTKIPRSNEHLETMNTPMVYNSVFPMKRN